MRVALRVLSGVLAVVLVLAGLVAAIELVLAAVGAAPWIVDWRGWPGFGRDHAWESGPVRLIGIGLIVVGIAALVLTWWPRRTVATPVPTPGGRVSLAVRGHGPAPGAGS